MPPNRRVTWQATSEILSLARRGGLLLGEDAAFFTDLDPPQTFVLRADEILGNERQTVWRSGRALQGSQRLQLDLACGSRCIAAIGRYLSCRVPPCAAHPRPAVDLLRQLEQRNESEGITSDGCWQNLNKGAFAGFTCWRGQAMHLVYCARSERKSLAIFLRLGPCL